MNMRYIDKSDCCKAFDRYLINSRPLAWNEFDDNIKLILHQHLYYEQGGLCIYCQQKLLPKTEKESNAHIRSHIEHIRPRSSYPYLTFDYCNLSVSCEGFDCEILKTNQQPKKEFCEHRKGNEYGEDCFLNPIEVKDIEDYFVYDDLTLEILPKYEKGTEEFKKADYMKKILDLNNNKLIRMREKVVKDIERNGPYEKHEKQLPPFYSMLLQLGLL
ncbi:MAG: TIGR02646 family protein [Candidatus Parabeggiatoa sp. nov. 2]|nr:MAG: TIGR02646 family protein [Beggiatoa sp. 4572_84]RKZ60565.1 MAG: TIGR02646 family protein [Gammaproteobacteria bacterium]